MSKLQIQISSFFLLLLTLPNMRIVAAVPSEHQDVWRIALYAVAHLPDSERYFSKLTYYRLENNRWQASDAETFFRTQQPDIPLIVFSPGYTSTTSQTTQVGLRIVGNFDSNKACRVVFWDWDSDRGAGNIRRDVRSKLPIIKNTSNYLAHFVQTLKPQSKVCLFGFSFGGRLICHAIETLQKNNRLPEGLRLHIVLSAAAADTNWFAGGQRLGRIAEIAEKILITYNPDDWALRFYPFMYPHRDRASALGATGLPLRSISSEEYRAKFENINVNRYIGTEHQTLLHVQTPVFRSRMDSYFFFE